MKFILSYFKTNDESMYLAESSDGLNWNELNGGEAVLSSAIGTKTIRDPFLLQFEDKYVMLSTDGWNSETIVYYDSNDLFNWSTPKLIDFSGNKFINCWAPEARKIGDEYYIYWSSSTKKKNEDDWDHRIYYSKTIDFQQFTKPKVFLKCDYSCIDATLFEFGGQLYMCYKDERINIDDEKSLKLGVFDAGRDVFLPLETKISKSWVEGPTTFESYGELYIYYDEYTREKWGLIKSKNVGTWMEVEDSLFKLPTDVRHGSILKLENENDT